MMIKDVHISNFKSVQDLSLSLGRFNVMIGENGCGKTNILEAMAFAGAASIDQLSVQELENRGMRVPSPMFMRSAFSGDDNLVIKVGYQLDNNVFDEFKMFFDPKDGAGEWIEMRRQNARTFLKNIGSSKDERHVFDQLGKMKDTLELDIDFNIKDAVSIGLGVHDDMISRFRVYSPNEQSLRRFDNPDNTTIRVDGVGLFSYLKKVAATERGKNMIKEIKECMDVLDWFDDIKIPADGLSGDNSILLCDQYIDENLRYFDQRSVNEAFLYLLFFFTLFISPDTPRFFAVDNIESALNPKLCRRFTERLIQLSEKYDKQVIVTTHNPFVLDALELNDDQVRLFVARRDVEGHTCINKIEPNPNMSVPLSEAWMKGYIGGLPNNF